MLWFSTVFADPRTPIQVEECMSISLVMVLVFVLGYLLIALEHKLDVNKSAVSLFLGVLLWGLYLINAPQFVLENHSEVFQRYVSEALSGRNMTLVQQVRDFVVNVSILEHAGDVAQIILFLMGAMTIVELIDRHDGFSFIKKGIRTQNSVRILWIITLMTFFMSALLDNMTTAIVMVMILRKIVTDRERRMLYDIMVILAANAGGAFSPIGDVTTIMLWIKGNVTSLNTVKDLFLPSLVSVIVPGLFFSYQLRGETEGEKDSDLGEHPALAITSAEKTAIFFIGAGGLILVPVVKSLTGLPPFLGVMGVLSLLWLYTEVMYRKKKTLEEPLKFRVSRVIKHIDMSTILFFFGILMAVGALQEAGVLSSFAGFLDSHLHTTWGLAALIGILSSVVDNVPLVAAAMGMYPAFDPSALVTVQDAAYMSAFTVDGQFWQMLAYCAGTGGSLLIIGSAAGVVVMGLEKLDFGWYFRRATLPAFVGYVLGIAAYMAF